MLQSRAVEFAEDEEGGRASVIKQASYLTSTQALLKPRGMLEQSYGLGFARVQLLPGTFGAIGLNPGLVEEMPVIGHGTASKLVIYHQGNFPGFLSSVFMIPDEDVVLLVLTNSLAFNDAADWLGQMVLEHIVDSPQKTGFVELAERSKETTLSMYKDFEDHLRQHDGIPNPHTRPLHDYTGTYSNSAATLDVRVIEQEGRLNMYFQDANWDMYMYPLTAYGNDWFSWGITYEEQVKRARWPIADVDYYKFRFVSGEDGEISHFRWRHDPNTEPDTFSKRA